MFLIILRDNWKKILILLAILGLFAGGYYYGRASVKPTIQVDTITKVVEKEVERKSQSTDHIVTTTTKKDGTTVVKVEDKVKTVETKTEVKENDKEIVQTPVPPTPKNWKVGLMAELQPSLKDITELKKPDLSYNINVSHRVIWNIWADAQYNWITKTVGVGASVDF